MIRFAACLVLLSLGSTEALAQIITRPTVTVSAGVLRAPDQYTEDGESLNERFDLGDTAPRRVFTSLSVMGEMPLARGRFAGASVGLRVRAASESTGFEDELFDDLFSATIGPEIQSVDVFGRVGNRNGSLLFGLSFDANSDPLAFDQTTDGQHAVFGQIREVVPVGPALAFVEIDLAHPFDRTTTVAQTTMTLGETVDLQAEVDGGDLYGAQVGASLPTGPVVVGLALSYAGRSDGQIEYIGTLPDGLPDDFERVVVYNPGFDNAFSLIPSVSWRPAATRLLVRAEGSFSSLGSMESIPVGFTIAGEEAPVVRPALTLSVGIGL